MLVCAVGGGVVGGSEIVSSERGVKMIRGVVLVVWWGWEVGRMSGSLWLDFFSVGRDFWEGMEISKRTELHLHAPERVREWFGSGILGVRF